MTVRTLSLFRRSQELLGRVRLMDQSGSTVNKLFDRFHDVDLRVNDLVKRIRESQRTVTEVSELSSHFLWR